MKIVSYAFPPGRGGLSEYGYHMRVAAKKSQHHLTYWRTSWRTRNRPEGFTFRVAGPLTIQERGHAAVRHPGEKPTGLVQS